MTNQTKMTDKELNHHYNTITHQAILALFDVALYSISKENMELYRAVGQAQDAIRKVSELIAKEGK